MSYGKSTKQYLYRMYDRHCAYCGGSLRISEVTLDHVYSKSKGGIRKLSNIKPSCRFCNNLKGDLTMNQFKAKIYEESKGDSDTARKVRNKFDIVGNHVTLYFEKIYKENFNRSRSLKSLFKQIKEERDAKKQDSL